MAVGGFVFFLRILISHLSASCYRLAAAAATSESMTKRNGGGLQSGTPVQMLDFVQVAKFPHCNV